MNRYSPNPGVNETIEALLALGCPPIPVAPRQDPRREWYHRVVKTKDGVQYCPVDKNFDPIPRFTGKNPSFLKRDGSPWICLHGEFQDRLPTEEELREFFCHPDTGVGTLGGHAGLDWLDFDKKCYDSQQDCDRDAERIISDNNLQGTWIERTGSDGWRIAVKPRQKPTFTNFATSPDGQHVGEALFEGRFTVLSPTIHPNGKPYRRVGWGEPVEVESLQAIGIYPSKDEVEQAARNQKREQRKASNPHYGQPTNPQDNPWDIRNFAHYFEGYHERSDGWAAAKCPHHNGTSLTSFRVCLDTGYYKLWCGCNTKDVYQSGLALAAQYRYFVNGGDGTPKGKDFAEIDKELASEAGVSLQKANPREYIPIPGSGTKFRIKRGKGDQEKFLASFPALAEKDGQEWLKLRQFTPDETIDSEYFYYDPPGEGEGLAVQSGLGTGKSYYTNENYVGEDDGAIFLGNRNTTISQFVENGKKRHNRTWYLIQQDLKEGGRDDLRLIQDPQSKIISCIDSILYIQSQDAVGKKTVFDEVESTLKHLNYSTTAVSYRRQHCKHRLAEITTEAHSTLLCDGNLKNITVRYVERLSGKKIKKVKNLYKGNRGKVTYYIGSEKFKKDEETNKWELVERRLNDYSLLLTTMMEDPGRFIVGADSQEQLETWDTQLKAKGRKTFRLDSTTSNTVEGQKCIRNPAKYIEENGIDVLLYSPSADQGLSIDLKNYFKRGYFFFFGVVLTDTQIQFLGRLRDAGCHLHVYCQVKHKDANSANNGLLSEELQRTYVEYAKDCASISLLDVDEETRSRKLIELAHKLAEKSSDTHYEYECQLLAMAHFEQNNLRNCLEYAMREAGWQIEVVTGSKVSTKESDEIKAANRTERSKKILAAAQLTAAEAQNIERSGIQNEEDKPKLARHKLLERLPGIENKFITEKKIVRVPTSELAAEKTIQNQPPSEAESTTEQGLEGVHIAPSESISYEGGCGQAKTSDEPTKPLINYEEAILKNERRIEANPSDSRAWAVRGLLLRGMAISTKGRGANEEPRKFFEEAIAAFEKALKLLEPAVSDHETDSRRRLCQSMLDVIQNDLHDSGEAIAVATDFVEVEQEVTRPVFDADFIKRVKFQDRGLMSRLESQFLLRNPHIAKLTQQKKWNKKLSLFQDETQVDGIKRINLTTYKSPWLKIHTLLEMGLGYFIQPESKWNQQTPEVIAFWEQGKDPQKARCIGMEVGDSDPCKYLGRVMDSYGLKREADGKITLPSGERVRQYRLKPLDPICQAIYDCVEAKVLALMGEEETVLNWAQIAEKNIQNQPPSKAESTTEQGLEGVHIAPSESISYEGGCGQTELEQLLEALPIAQSAEDFASIIEGSPLETVEEAIVLQDDQQRRVQLTQWLVALNQLAAEVEPLPLKRRSWEWSQLPLLGSVLRWVDRFEQLHLLAIDVDGFCQVQSLLSGLITNTHTSQLMPVSAV